MPNYFTKLTIANASYDIMDVEARELISSLSQALIFVGVTTTVITDGQATPSTYGGLSGITIPSGHTSTDTVDTGTVVIYDGHEFVWDGAKWAEFGSTYQWTPVLTKDSVLGANTTFTPTHTSTATSTLGAHTHTIDSLNIANLLNQGVLKVTLGGNKKLSTNNLDIGSQSGSVETTVVTGVSSSGSGNDVLSSFSAGSTPPVISAATNSDGVNTYTISIADGTAPSATTSHLTTGSQSLSLQATVGIGTISSNGTGSSVATGSLEADANGEVYTTIGLAQSTNINPGTGEVFWVNGAKYNGVAPIEEQTSSAGDHSHDYDKTTGTTVGTNDLVDAVINVTLQ